MANPVTEVTRPVLSLLDYAKDACIAAGVPSRVYTGTTYAGLAESLPALLVESKGKPCAVVCYSGSKYGNAPRRVSSVAILVIQGHTRALFPAFGHHLLHRHAARHRQLERTQVDLGKTGRIEHGPEQGVDANDGGERW